MQAYSILQHLSTQELKENELNVFFEMQTWSGAYGDIVWVGVLQSNADLSKHGATKYAACGLAAHVTLEAAENAIGNVAEHATCGAMYHSAGEVVASSI